MIEPNALRIGNNLHFKTQDGSLIPINVGDITNDGVNVYAECVESNSCELRVMYKFKDLFPIVLSPEILENAGCVAENKRYYWRSHLLFELYNVTTLEDGFKIKAGRMTNNVALLVSKEIEYLHQLQNIFYALTGEELLITL